MEEEKEKEKGPVVDETLIDAFSATFSPVHTVEDADEMFTDCELRRILSAYIPYGAPDPLVEAKLRLESLGFTSTILPDSTPVLLAGRRNRAKEHDFTHLISQLPEVEEDLLMYAISLEEEEEEEQEKDMQYIPFDMVRYN